MAKYYHSLVWVDAFPKEESVGVGMCWFYSLGFLDFMMRVSSKSGSTWPLSLAQSGRLSCLGAASKARSHITATDQVQQHSWLLPHNHMMLFMKDKSQAAYTVRLSEKKLFPDCSNCITVILLSLTLPASPVGET